jgi:hypothetical protein
MYEGDLVRYIIECDIEEASLAIQDMNPHSHANIFDKDCRFLGIRVLSNDVSRRPSYDWCMVVGLHLYADVRSLKLGRCKSR